MQVFALRFAGRDSDVFMAAVDVADLMSRLQQTRSLTARLLDGQVLPSPRIRPVTDRERQKFGELIEHALRDARVTTATQRQRESAIRGLMKTTGLSFLKATQLYLELERAHGGKVPREVARRLAERPVERGAA